MFEAAVSKNEYNLIMNKEGRASKNSSVYICMFVYQLLFLLLLNCGCKQLNLVHRVIVDISETNMILMLG